MDWLSDLGQINTYSSIPVQIAGFAIAYWQIAKARNAAESARRAVLSTEAAVAKNRVLTLAPQLRRIEQSLSSAIDRKSQDLALHDLDDWRYHAAELRGMLKSVGIDDESLFADIQNSITQAKLSVQALRRASPDVPKVTSNVHKAMMDVTAKITERTSSLVGHGAEYDEHD